MLEFVPEHWKVIKHVRPKYSCSACQKIVQANATSRPIGRSYAGPGLLAHVLVAKYCDHLPFYRQSQIYARDGVEIERATLADWGGAASALLDPLLGASEDYVMGADKLHADDTPIPVLTPGTGKTKTGRLWAYVRDDRPAGSTDPPAVLLRYSPDRKGERPRAHLQDFRGILQAEAYGGFNGLYDRAHEPLIEAACWAHARRGLFEAEAADPAAVHEGLTQIAALYAVEEQICTLALSGEAKQLHRLTHSKPIVAGFFDWIERQLRRQGLTPANPLTKALAYARERRAGLEVFLTDPAVPIDTNHLERALRVIPMGRKSWLFYWTELGARHVGIVQRLIVTCRLHGVDPYTYLVDVLQRVAAHPAARVAELTPRLWKRHFADRPLRFDLDDFPP